MQKEGFYRVKVEERNGGDAAARERALVLHVYRDGVEVEALDFELSVNGARGLLDEMRWQEWRKGQ